MEQANEGTEAVRQLLQAVKEQTAIQKQLPAPVSYTHLDVYKRQQGGKATFPFLFRQLSPFHKPMPPIPFTIFLVTFLPISLLASCLLYTSRCV